MTRNSMLLIKLPPLSLSLHWLALLLLLEMVKAILSHFGGPGIALSNQQRPTTTHIFSPSINSHLTCLRESTLVRLTSPWQVVLPKIVLMLISLPASQAPPLPEVIPTTVTVQTTSLDPKLMLRLPGKPTSPTTTRGSHSARSSLANFPLRGRSSLVTGVDTISTSLLLIVLSETV